MKGKHSPAPWVVERRGYRFIVSKPGEGYITRDVCRMDDSTLSAFDQEANARLIGASPKLIDALRSCLAVLERTDCSTGYCCCGSRVDAHGMFDGHTPVDEGDYYRDKAIEAARAAIAEAEG